MTETIDIFKALSDEVRLRIIRALFSAELSVAELVSVLGLPQSTVSRHLKPLRDADLVESRREGTSVYYRRGKALEEQALAQMLEARVQSLPGGVEDQASVKRLLDARRQRSREFFDRIAGSYGALTQPGGGWRPLVSGLCVGFSGKRVADLGAGEGDLTLLLARYAEEVTVVDQSAQMLRLVQEHAAQQGVSERVVLAEGDLEDLPLEDQSVDVAFLSQALHHSAGPAKAVSEAVRILKPGGWLVVLDLFKHDQEWVREQWADQWLGFEVAQVEAWMRDAGLEKIHSERLEGSAPELAVMVVTGFKL